MASDLISRKKLLDLYDGLELLEDADWDSAWNVPLEVIVQNIKDMPTVYAVEVVHGEWITKCMEGSWTHYRYSCSNCGSGFDSNSNYCPNCGADMRGNCNE